MAYSVQLTEVNHIAKKYQLLHFNPFFSQNKHNFSDLTFDLVVRCSLTRWFQKTRWRVSTTFLTEVIKKTKLWPPITSHTKVARGSTHWLFLLEGTFDIRNWGQKYRKPKIKSRSPEVKLRSRVIPKRNDLTITIVQLPTQSNISISSYW